VCPAGHAVLIGLRVPGKGCCIVRCERVGILADGAAVQPQFIVTARVRDTAPTPFFQFLMKGKTMPILGTVYQFTEYNIECFAPDRMGVYALYQGQELTYYGRATKSIRDRVHSHKAGYEGRCTQVSTHFNWEQTSDPVGREMQLLEEYMRAKGRLPQCNERVG
jgi:hypothetical protein